MKLDDWIKPYGVDDQMEQTEIESEVVQYMIPSYKIDRLRDADKSANKIDNLITQVKLLEKAIESNLPSMLPNTVEILKPILDASKGISHE